MESKQSQLEIVCPNCEEENVIKLSSDIKCKNCEKDLTKWKYSKFVQKVIGAGTAFVIGGTTAYQVGKHMYEENRYPVAVEYSIVNSCISAYSEPLRRVYMRQKKDICICALSKTMKKIDYDDYEKDKNKFLDIFEVKANACQ